MKSACPRFLLLFLSAMFALSACQQQPASKDKSKPGASAMKSGMGMAASGNFLGKAFTLTEKTDLAALLEAPKKFEGKTVRVAGVITAHCHHRRAWFALRTASDSPASLRVMTKPAFLVPKNVKHNQTLAEAEGVVVIRTIPESTAKHYAKEHGLFGGRPDRVTGPQHIVSLKATGAKFR